MSERPVHGQDEHFDELLAGRVVTEAMTQFPEGTPLMEVLEWLHERLSLSETGAHVVAGMSMDAEYFQPTFPIDAVKREVFPDTFTMNARFPIAPIDPEFIPMTAWLTGYNTVDAAVLGIRPVDRYFHYDDMSNQQEHTWGDGSSAGSYSYDGGTQPDNIHQWRHLKADEDPEPADYVYDYQGMLVEVENEHPFTWLHDDALTNKRVLINISIGVCTNIWSCVQRFHFRGPNNYVEWRNEARGHGHKLVVDGATVYDAGGVTVTGWRWLKIEALDHVVRFKMWADGAGEPEAWVYEHRTATPTAGPSGINWRGRSGGIVSYVNQGSPWTHRLRHFSVEGINAGPIHTSAYLRPAPFSASAWFSSGNDAIIDAFIEPSFRLDSLLVNYVPGNFTIGGFKEDRVEQGAGMDAFVGGYGNIDAVIGSDAVFGQHTADAWKVLTTEDSVVTDAVLHDTDRTYSVTADAITKDLDLSDVRTVDAYKNLLQEGDHVIDGFIGPGAHPGMDAVVKGLDLPGDFTMNATTWPEGVELFVVNAVKHQPDSYSGTLNTIDAAIDYIGERHENAHWDDFNRGSVAAGWGAPSHSGKYTYSDGTAGKYVPAPTAGGNSYGHWYVNTGDRYIYARDPLTIDREMSLDAYITPGGGIQVGNIYFYINNRVRIRKYHGNGGAWYLEVYFNDSTWHGLTTWSIGADYDWKSIKIKVTGTHIQAKAWDRSGSEPGWMYDAYPDWTPTTGQPRIHHSGQSWFGSGGNPWNQRFDNWFVSGGGFPFSHNVNSVFRVPDNPGSVAMDSVFVPQPFSMDAFIEGYGNIDARIWLGTTFPADAMIQTTEQESTGDITYQYVNSNGAGSWTHSPPAGAKTLVVFGNRSGSASATYGNVTITTSGNVIHYIALDQVAHRDDDVIRMASASSVQGSIWLISENPVEFVKTGGYTTLTNDMEDDIHPPAGRFSVTNWGTGNKNPFTGAVIYTDDGDAGELEDHAPQTGQLLTQGHSTNPIIGWSSAFLCNVSGPDIYTHVAGMASATNGGSGTTWLFRSVAAPTNMQAWIQAGAHMPFSASLVGHHIQAWIKTINNMGSFTADAVRHQLGEQLKSFVADGEVVPSVSEQRYSQFGWQTFGEALQWADVSPERERDMLSIAAEIFRPTYYSDMDADAYLVPQPFTIAATKQDTMEFGGWEGGPPTIDAMEHGPSTSSRSWTHTNSISANGIVVTITNKTDGASAVSYGGVSLTNVRNGEIYGRRVEMWFSGDISGASGSTVSVSGIGGTNTFFTSTLIKNSGTFVSQTGGSTGWAGWGVGDHTFTHSDSISGPAWKMGVTVVGGEGAGVDDGMSAYQGDGTGHWIGSGYTASDNGMATTISFEGPDTSSLTYGTTQTQANGARFHIGQLFAVAAVPDAATGMNANAVIDQGHFRVDAEKRSLGMAPWLVENYDDSPDEGPPPDSMLTVYMWQRYR